MATGRGEHWGAMGREEAVSMPARKQGPRGLGFTVGFSRVWVDYQKVGDSSHVERELKGK
ncbi:ANK_REP_REGION domain-containing protein [Psidium guajava]|nr:ANK_REP_REGION domain-containing protein [Psidium guajava]